VRGAGNLYTMNLNEAWGKVPAIQHFNLAMRLQEVTSIFCSNSLTHLLLIQLVWCASCHVPSQNGVQYV
jgi:hypothetical protein